MNTRNVKRGITPGALAVLALATGFALGVFVTIVASFARHEHDAQLLDAALQSFASCLEKCP